MKWIKKGLVFGPDCANEFNIYNTQVPYAYLIDNKIRIYYGARRKNSNFAEVFFIEVDVDNPEKIIYVHETPVLGKGVIGAFDQDGVLPVCIKKFGKNCTYILEVL